MLDMNVLMLEMITLLNLNRVLTSNEVFPQILSKEAMSDLDDDGLYFGACFDDNNAAEYDLNENEFDLNKYASLGKYDMIIKAEMDATDNIIRNVGWLDHCPDESLSVNKKPVEPEKFQSATTWKAIVQKTRERVISEKTQHISVAMSKSSKFSKHSDPNANNVMVVDQSYFEYHFKANNVQRQMKVDTTVLKFYLNSEQERAFRIIANHSSSPCIEQLKLYLGGMAGTGKSQVIKALMDFFTVMKESHRFVVLGPTGTAAAQQNGSTYHYFLGINPSIDNRNEAKAIAQLKSRLEGVDYNFIDEISMLSCHDMYKISSKLAKALNVHDKPFGGVIVFSV
jgi:PIF1-like helicase